MNQYWDKIRDNIWEPISEPLIGWRVWHIDREGRLMPLAVRSDVWAEGRPFYTSQCELANRKRSRLPHVPEHESPSPFCTCGFWAYKARHRAMQYFGGDSVMGRVQIWGKIVECTFGYRAQYLRPRELYLRNAIIHERNQAALEERYGIPVELITSRALRELSGKE